MLLVTKILIVTLRFFLGKIPSKVDVDEIAKTYTSIEQQTLYFLARGLGAFILQSPSYPDSLIIGSEPGNGPHKWGLTKNQFFPFARLKLPGPHFPAPRNRKGGTSRDFGMEEVGHGTFLKNEWSGIDTLSKTSLKLSTRPSFPILPFPLEPLHFPNLVPIFSFSTNSFLFGETIRFRR